MTSGVVAAALLVLELSSCARANCISDGSNCGCILGFDPEALVNIRGSSELCEDVVPMLIPAG